MAKATIEGKTKFVRSFNTQKGTAYSGVIGVSKKNEETGAWTNCDIRFVYFGYDKVINDGDIINIKGTLGIDDYNPEDPKLQLTGFELLPVQIKGNKDGDTSIGRLDAHLDNIQVPADNPF